MTQQPIRIGGIPIPFHEPVFLAIVAVHVAAGVVCVLAGAVAMLSPKVAGRHPRFGTLYYWSLILVSVTMMILALERWAEDYHLFVLGCLSFAAAVLGRRAAPSREIGRVRVHVVGMGASYILLLTAFYVDNGPNLPIWSYLPTVAYWLLPIAVGAPLIARALHRNPVVPESSR